MSTSLPLSVLRRLPKVDLHLHLDGALRLSTILDLAREHGVPLPGGTVQELLPHVQVPVDCRSLEGFLSRFEVFYPVLRFPGAMRRAARELCEDVASDGVTYMETRFAPLLQETRSYPLEAVVEDVLQGLREGTRATGVRAQAILCCYRPFPPEENVRTVRAALRYRDQGVCGVDLAGNEVGFPIDLSQEAFALARRHDLPITMHAGEAGGSSEVREAVWTHGAQRIGHGTQAGRDPFLLDELARRGVTLEVCLTSNLQTGAVARMEDHPLPKFLERGVPVALCTDDPSMSAITLSDEYERARRTFGLGLSELGAMARDAVRSAFMPDGERKRLEAQVLEGFRAAGEDAK